jgi:hypothetical protein
VKKLLEWAEAGRNSFIKLSFSFERGQDARFRIDER